MSAAGIPLVPGWTEHISPTGQPYYFHAATNQSTYIRPISSYPTLSTFTQHAAPSPPLKKEKPLSKIPIPNTAWSRVRTTHGNVFFTHAEQMTSIWTVPEDIADVVQTMDWNALEEAAAREKEVARIAKEVAKESAKRKAEEETAKEKEEPAQPKKKRRKKDTPVAVEDLAINEIVIASDALTEEAAEIADEDAEDDDADSGSEAAFSSEEAEARWHREMEEGLAKVAAGEVLPPPPDPGASPRSPSAEPLEQEAPEKEAIPAFNVPAQINLSPEEARTLFKVWSVVLDPIDAPKLILFKTLLTEKNPSPLAPFMDVMPLLITDPRYVLLASQADREAAFNEWCRDIARAKRLNKIKPSSITSAIADSSSLPTAGSTVEDARVTYDALLRAEAFSTRTTWDSFRRTWKKDRRFFGFGRDDRERETVFRAWMKELSEKKRAQARKAEIDFMALLKEHAKSLKITRNSEWKDVKRPLVKDARYDAVGSSTLRLELFETFLKALDTGGLTPTTTIATPNAPINADATQVPLSAEARRARAISSRMQQAAAVQGKINAEIGVRRAELEGAEAELAFTSFLTDAVRDATATYASIENLIESHPRVASSPLSQNEKRSLFGKHISRLEEKQRAALENLFTESAPGLAVRWNDLGEDARKKIMESAPAEKLGLGGRSGTGRTEERMEEIFQRWQSRRASEARSAFQSLLTENAFVEFWGKVGRIGDASKDGNGLDLILGEEDLGMNPDGEAVGAGGDDDAVVGRPDLKTLAKGIGEQEIERVLKNDARYRAFDHIPAERMRWVKDYLSTLSAPELSVHVQHQH